MVTNRNDGDDWSRKGKSDTPVLGKKVAKGNSLDIPKIAKSLENVFNNSDKVYWRGGEIAEEMRRINPDYCPYQVLVVTYLLRHKILLRGEGIEHASEYYNPRKI